jgi:hypothetical protein
LIDSVSQVRDGELLLLVGYCLPLALAGAGVVLGPLAAEGQAETVTDAALATNVHQALDVHLDLRAKLTFNANLGDDFADFGDFVVVPVLDALVLGDSGLGENFRGAGASDAVDVGQGNYSSLVPGDVDTGDTGQGESV